MDLQSPAAVAVVVAVVAAVLQWAYAKWMLKDPAPEKVLAKALACNVVAAVAVVLYTKQYEPVPSLQADPFFAPMI